MDLQSPFCSSGRYTDFLTVGTTSLTLSAESCLNFSGKCDRGSSFMRFSIRFSTDLQKNFWRPFFWTKGLQNVCLYVFSVVLISFWRSLTALSDRTDWETFGHFLLYAINDRANSNIERSPRGLYTVPGKNDLREKDSITGLLDRNKCNIRRYIC